MSKLRGVNLGEWLVLENDDPKPNGIDDITRSMAYFKANL